MFSEPRKKLLGCLYVYSLIFILLNNDLWIIICVEILYKYTKASKWDNMRPSLLNFSSLTSERGIFFFKGTVHQTADGKSFSYLSFFHRTFSDTNTDPIYPQFFQDASFPYIISWTKSEWATFKVNKKQIVITQRCSQSDIIVSIGTLWIDFVVKTWNK